jgi:hypothetical protein
MGEVPKQDLVGACFLALHERRAGFAHGRLTKRCGPHRRHSRACKAEPQPWEYSAVVLGAGKAGPFSARFGDLIVGLLGKDSQCVVDELADPRCPSVEPSPSRVEHFNASGPRGPGRSRCWRSGNQVITVEGFIAGTKSCGRIHGYGLQQEAFQERKLHGAGT